MCGYLIQIVMLLFLVDLLTICETPDILKSRGLNLNLIVVIAWLAHSLSIQSYRYGGNRITKNKTNSLAAGQKSGNPTCRQLCLQVAIMNQGRLVDECVGRTFIDMEDRFFNPKVAQMVEQEVTPIELRQAVFWTLPKQ